MSNNSFDMGFREYFYYHPCCKCKNKYEDCAKRLALRDFHNGDMDNTAAMILNRLERIMIDNTNDCWDGDL